MSPAARTLSPKVGIKQQGYVRSAEEVEVAQCGSATIISGFARNSDRLIVGCSLRLGPLTVDSVVVAKIEAEIGREVPSLVRGKNGLAEGIPLCA